MLKMEKWREKVNVVISILIKKKKKNLYKYMCMEETKYYMKLMMFILGGHLRLISHSF